MANDVYRTHIEASPEDVFAYVSDLSRHPEWSGTPLRIEKIEDGSEGGVGARFRSVGFMLRKERENELKVTEVDSPNRFVFTAQDSGLGEIVHTFEFTPDGNGTRMVRTVAIPMSAMMGVMNMLVIRPFIAGRHMSKAFKSLKEHLES